MTLFGFDIAKSCHAWLCESHVQILKSNTQSLLVLLSWLSKLRTYKYVVQTINREYHCMLLKICACAVNARFGYWQLDLLSHHNLQIEMWIRSAEQFAESAQLAARNADQKVQIDFLSQNKLQIKMQIDLPTCRPTAERIGNFADHFALYMILIPLHTLVLFYSWHRWPIFNLDHKWLLCPVINCNCRVSKYKTILEVCQSFLPDGRWGLGMRPLWVGGHYLECTHGWPLHAG